MDDDDRDIPTCPYLFLPGEGLVHRPLPGWPRYQVRYENSIWHNQVAANGPHAIAPRWKQLRPIRRPGRPPSVILRHEGRECERLVSQLIRAAYSDPSRHEAWARKIGPMAHCLARRRTRTPDDVATPPPAIVTTDPPAEPACPAPATPDRPDASVEYHPVPGYPSYLVGTDYTAWSVADGIRRRVPEHPRPGRRPAVILRRPDGIHQLVTLAGLLERALRVEDTTGRPPRPPSGDPRQGTAAKGSAHGRAVLTEATVAEARRLHRQGLSYAELAQRFGVREHTMGYAVRGITWRHVPMDAT